MTLLRVDGVVAYWSLTEFTRLDKLRDGLDAAGFRKYAPDPRSAQVCLKDALGDVFPRMLVQPLAGRDAWEVREIVRGEEENQYLLRHRVALRDGATPSPKIALAPFDAEVGSQVASRFNDFRGLVRCAQVTAAMTAILRELRGTSLRPRGSIYWMPEKSMGEWQQVIDAVQKAGVGGENRCYLIRHAMDADAVRAVRDAIVAEVTTESARLKADVESGELGERALRTREAEARDLRDRVVLYEELLQTGLGVLHQKLDETEASVSMASLQITVLAGAA